MCPTFFSFLFFSFLFSVFFFFLSFSPSLPLSLSLSLSLSLFFYFFLILLLLLLSVYVKYCTVISCCTVICVSCIYRLYDMFYQFHASLFTCVVASCRKNKLLSFFRKNNFFLYQTKALVSHRFLLQ
jgi:hypothetical protein